MKASAKANANIALIKYWGKKDKTLNIPFNSSLSVTLDKLFTITSVEFNKDLSNDIFVINDSIQSDSEHSKLSLFLDLVRNRAGINFKAKVISENNFPTASGLASSSSGFAALALAATKAAGLNLSPKELSILARKGSGSASRSVYGGFVMWEKGEAGVDESSFATQLFDENYWPEFKVVVVILQNEKKDTSSRDGMNNTVATSPFYNVWLATIDEDLKNLRNALKNKRFSALGETAELNCLKMHATMLTAKPSLVYWNSQTVELMKLISKWRAENLEVYFTIDAGPQVKILCLDKDLIRLQKKLSELKFIQNIIVCSAGSGAKLI